MRFMQLTAAPLALVMLGVVLAACGGSAGEPVVARTVDVSALTFAEYSSVRARRRRSRGRSST
jgi:hypothetical protein